MRVRAFTRGPSRGNSSSLAPFAAGVVWPARLTMLRHGPMKSLLLFALLLGGFACEGCEEKEGIEREGKRVWGADKESAEAAKLAEETIDVNAVANRPDAARRVLDMEFNEVAARLGPVVYAGKATFELRRNGRGFEVVEDTRIEQGLHGSWHTQQKDAKGTLLREVFHYNGVYALRNGPGKLRAAGSLNGKTGVSRNEAFEPLSTYTKYFGPRLGLSPQGKETASDRSAQRFDFVLLEGSEFVEVKGMKGKKKPVSVKGSLWLDEEKGVPLKVVFDGQLEIPAPKAGGKPGSLKLSLRSSLKTVAGRQIVPDSEPVATIERHPVDLDPLEFLDGGTRTSTIIGGKKKKKKSRPDAGS